MAQPPDISESFAREVDENLRRDQARDFLKTYGSWIIAAIVLFLAAVGGYLYWQDRQAAKAAEQSEELAAIYRDIGTGKMKAAAPRLDALSDSHSDAIRASAILARAAVALEQNDRSTALAKYRALAADDGLPQTYRDLGTIRSTAIEFDSLKPEEVIARMEPLAKPGNAWFGSAGELTAMAYLKQGRKSEAGRLFAAIAADRQVPDTLRSRAVQIAGTLGVDASASMPQFDQ